MRWYLRVWKEWKKKNVNALELSERCGGSRVNCVWSIYRRIEIRSNWIFIWVIDVDKMHRLIISAFTLLWPGIRPGIEMHTLLVMCAALRHAFKYNYFDYLLCESSAPWVRSVTPIHTLRACPSVHAIFACILFCDCLLAAFSYVRSVAVIGVNANN